MALPASIAASASSLAASCTGMIDSAHTLDLFQKNDNRLVDLLDVLHILSSTLSAMALFWTINQLVAISDELSEILQILSTSFNHCNLSLKQIQGAFEKGEREILSSSDIWCKRIQAHADATALVMEASIGGPDISAVDIISVKQLIKDMKQAVEEQGNIVTLNNTQGIEMESIINNMEILMDKVHQYGIVMRSEGGTISVSTAEEGPSGPNTARVLTSAQGFMTAKERTLNECHNFSKIRELIYHKEFTAVQECVRLFHTEVALTLESRRLLAEYYYLGAMFGQMIEILKCPREILERDKFLASNVQHLLAKAFFGIGEFDKAIEYSHASLDTRRDLIEHDQPTFLESVELLVAILRATGRFEEAIAARKEYLSAEYRQSFEIIDTIGDLFQRDKPAAVEFVIQMLDSNYGRENLMSRVQGMNQFLESIKEREFHDVILGFGTGVSLVTVFTDMDAGAWVGLLGIRGIISRDRVPGSRCLAFDNLLRKAAKQGVLSEVYVLRSFGADVEAGYDSLAWWPQLPENLENRSPLCLASEAGHSDVVALLLGGHTNIEARGYSQMTPLIFAAQGGNATTVRLLLHRGADIEAKDENQRTALSHAAQSGHIEVVELLLDWGADMETIDADGKNPLQYTVPFGHLPIFNLMLQVGAYRQIQMN